MTVGVLWALVLGFGGMGIGSALLTGPSHLTVALALIATGVAILALVCEGPTEGNDRRRW